MTTELEAVNTILTSAGLRPVSSLSNESTSDSARARSILTETSREVQTKGYPFNTKLNVTLTANGDDQVIFSSRTIRVAIAIPFNKRYVIRGLNGSPALYDRYNQSYTVTETVTAELVVEYLDWQDLPEAACRYIMIKAARIFLSRVVRDTQLSTAMYNDEVLALTQLRQDQSVTDGVNMGYAPGVAEVIYRNANLIGWAQ